MKNELLALALASSKEIKAIYTYTLSENKTIPVLIVSMFDQKLADALRPIHKDWWIVLTLKDLEHGHDVYCMQLLHIKARSVCERWNDYLSKIHIKKSEMRPHLEWYIRHMLIDLKEMMIHWQNLTDIRFPLLIQCDRIRTACSYYLDKKFFPRKSTRLFLKHMKKNRWVDHRPLFEKLQSSEQDCNLEYIHKDLSLLVHHVDSLE